MLAFDRELTDLVDGAGFTSQEARGLARIGLANYFAGALIMPYGRFLAAAEARGYDIELLGYEFGVGFETVCHRLSTLQRQGARGVPFFFIRVDRAGNISKRQSATDFHFSRVGGTCPLWNVYEAFASPGRILTQLARMPDERTYLWIARTVSHARGKYGAPTKTFAIALGCDVRHAERVVYSRGHQPQGLERNADRHGLQGLRASGLRAARLSADRPRAADRRDAIPLCALCHVVTGERAGWISGKTSFKRRQNQVLLPSAPRWLKNFLEIAGIGLLDPIDTLPRITPHIDVTVCRIARFGG